MERCNRQHPRWRHSGRISLSEEIVLLIQTPHLHHRLVVRKRRHPHYQELSSHETIEGGLEIVVFEPCRASEGHPAREGGCGTHLLLRGHSEPPAHEKGRSGDESEPAQPINPRLLMGVCRGSATPPDPIQKKTAAPRAKILEGVMLAKKATREPLK